MTSHSPLSILPSFFKFWRAIWPKAKGAGGRLLASLRVALCSVRLTGRFKHELDLIPIILRLERDDIIGSRALQDFSHVAQVDAQGNVAIGAVELETVFAKEEGDQGDVGGIHG